MVPGGGHNCVTVNCHSSAEFIAICPIGRSQFVQFSFVIQVENVHSASFNTSLFVGKLSADDKKCAIGGYCGAETIISLAIGCNELVLQVTSEVEKIGSTLPAFT